MLAFYYHIGLSLALLALAAGAGILIWAKKHADLNPALSKVIGYLVIILSVTNILCAGYYGLKYWAEGYMDKPFLSIALQPAAGGMMMPCPMMQQMMSGQMMQCPMMQQMRRDKTAPGQMMQQPMMSGQMGRQQMQNQMMQNQPIPSQTVPTQMDMNNVPQNKPVEMQNDISSSSDHAEHHNYNTNNANY